MKKPGPAFTLAMIIEQTRCSARCTSSVGNKKADPEVGFFISRESNYFDSAGAAGAAGASAAGAAGASAAGADAAGASAGAAGAAAGASAAGGVVVSGAGASSFLLQAVRAIANRDAISRVFVMIVFQ
jgi:hypothetical protein